MIKVLRNRKLDSMVTIITRNLNSVFIRFTIANFRLRQGRQNAKKNVTYVTFVTFYTEKPYK